MLAGCAVTAPSAEQAANSLELALKEAEGEVAAGRHEKALALLDQAAKDHPTSGVPWLQIARIWFDKGSYSSSIVAANEVLQRDATNQAAKSMLVVGGFRDTADSVNGLRPGGPVGANTRLEAENLTQSLRAALGEKELVPTAEIKQSTAAPRPKAKAGAKAGAVATPVARRNTSEGGADPFKSLK